MKPLVFLVLAVLSLRCSNVNEPAPQQPNVILVITDDQGYNDISAHGNPILETPNLDALWAESVRLTDFHVDPTCSPTRSALMSGRYSTRTGVWHTIMGRSLMRAEEVTLAEAFSANGYHTGMIGKWHLGDNYPLRPMDQGFQEAVWHKSGGVGQGADYWGNDYFDDTYWRGDTPEPFEGYCTDVWFREASAFIERNRDAPFFLYLSTNAPHGPYLVDESYSRPYAEKGVPAPADAFYGMIANIDENVGRLRAKLDELGVAENTIFIFMTDNGTSIGEIDAGAWKAFDAGMRGIKGSEYDGGHRVPFFVHWPAGGLDEGRDVDGLAAHIDVLPTLADLTGIVIPAGSQIDGASFHGALYNEAPIEDRTLFVHSQRIEYPEKWRKSAVMTPQWRLVNGSELYDIENDPSQERDVAGQNPTVVEELRAAYDTWWASLMPGFDEYVRIGLGNEAENPVHLMSHDWHTDNEPVPWHQRHVENGLESNGFWAVDVEESGAYEIKLLRWPNHLDQAMGVVQARLAIGSIDETISLNPGVTEAVFEVDLEAGPTTLQSWLTTAENKVQGAYFVKVLKKEPVPVE